MKKKLFLMLGVVVLLGGICGGIDYYRVRQSKEPIFMIRATSGDGSVWHSIGLGYRMKREVSVSYSEPYSMDKEVRFGLWIYTWKLDYPVVIDPTYTIDVIKSESCSKKLYYEEDDKSIYLYCLDGIQVNDGEKTLELREFLQERDTSIENFTKMFLVSTTYGDGGSKMYRELIEDENSSGFTNQGLSILECNTASGNRDVYLGASNMEYEDGFCKFPQDEEMKRFIRTYQVTSIENDSKDDQFVSLTLSQFQGESNVKVRVLASLVREVKMGYFYEFLFEYQENQFENTIQGIFENATLVEIHETDKVGLEQIQDEVQ